MSLNPSLFSCLFAGSRLDGVDAAGLIPTILFALLGLLIGAMINQLGYDLPARRKITAPHCPYCGRNRPWWQWLSLPAFLIGRARCPHCAAPIRLRHLLTELGLAATYVFLWITYGRTTTLVLYLYYFTVFALVLITDIERRLILNVVMLPSILLGFLASFVNPNLRWDYALLGGAVGLVFFQIAAWVGNAAFGSGALGGGDVTLATFIGLIIGFPMIIQALVLTLLIGAGISLLLVITGLRKLGDHIPYGPFLVAGAIITLLTDYSLAWRFLL